MTKQQVKHFDTVHHLSEAAAEYIRESCLFEVQQKGFFTMVLSGGATPRTLYEVLGAPPYDTILPWDQIHLFWGDERCLPADHGQSNYALVKETLLSRIAIPEQNVHRVPTELGDPVYIADAYEMNLQDFFAQHQGVEGGGTFPFFDLLLQGMGGDGHTASLFPGDASLLEKQKWVVPVKISPTEPIVPRITLTLPVINHGKRVVFLCVGERKQQLFKTFQQNAAYAVKNYPAAMVNPPGELIWFWA